MARAILIIGKSGTGKSRSIKFLDPNESFLVNVCGKELPFKGKPFSKENGNYFETDNSDLIIKALKKISDLVPNVNTVVIDDFQYVMANEFMRRAKEKGYEKFTEIGLHAWEIVNTIKSLRDDLTVFILSHSETTDSGESKCKTIGKMLDDKICLEGMFTIVLNTAYEDNKYFFETQTNGSNTSKSPEGMFDSLRIENNLKLVVDSINNYNKGE